MNEPISDATLVKLINVPTTAARPESYMIVRLAAEVRRLREALANETQQVTCLRDVLEKQTL